MHPFRCMGWAALCSSAHPPFMQGQTFRLDRVVYIKMQISYNPSAIFSFVPVDGTSDRLFFCCLCKKITCTVKKCHFSLITINPRWNRL